MGKNARIHYFTIFLALYSIATTAYITYISIYPAHCHGIGGDNGSGGNGGDSGDTDSPTMSPTTMPTRSPLEDGATYPPSSSPTESPTELVTNPPTESPTELVTNPPTTINGGNETPFQVLKLNNWKLNGFTGSGESGTKYKDKIDNLETYESDKYFWTDGNWVYFRAHAGLPTSSGSGNPRSELRELDSSGKNIYWTGTSDIMYVMEWKIKVVKLPSSGKACFGQIHDKTKEYDDVIRTQFERGSNGKIRMKVMGWVTEENDDKKGDYLDDFPVALNKEMHLEMRMGRKRVELIDKKSGNTIYKYDGKGSKQDELGAKENYFKAGIYLQSMKGKGWDTSDDGVVAIRYLKISKISSREDGEIVESSEEVIPETDAYYEDLRSKAIGATIAVVLVGLVMVSFYHVSWMNKKEDDVFEAHAIAYDVDEKGQNSDNPLYNKR